MDAAELEALFRQNSRAGVLRAERAHLLAGRAAQRARREWALVSAGDGDADHHARLAQLYEQAQELHERAAALQDEHAVSEGSRADSFHLRFGG